MNTYIVMIRNEATTDAKKFLEQNEGSVLDLTSAHAIREYLNTKLGKVACAVYTMSDYMDKFNEYDEDLNCDDDYEIDLNNSFMGYVYGK